MNDMFLSGKSNKMNTPDARKRRTKCAVNKCQLIAVAKTYCDNHYRRFKRYGNPLFADQRGNKKKIDNIGLTDKEVREKYKMTLPGRYASLKGKAQNRNIECSLTYTQYLKIVENDCVYCGGDFFKLKDYNGYYVDRVDNDKGYHFDNCIPCCKICNRIKGDNFTHEQTKAAVEAILMFGEFE